MTTDERDIIKTAQSRGAVFKRDGKTRWMWQGGEYSYKTRLDAAYEYLDASHLSNSATTTATLSPKQNYVMKTQTDTATTASAQPENVREVHDYRIENSWFSKNKCQACNGSGHDKSHKWTDGSFAACEACDGYGRIDSNRTQFATLPDDVRENLTAAVYSHELSAILNYMAEIVRQAAEEIGYDEQRQMEDDARIVFHAAAHVSN